MIGVVFGFQIFKKYFSAHEKFIYSRAKFELFRLRTGSYFKNSQNTRGISFWHSFLVREIFIFPKILFWHIF